MAIEIKEMLIKTSVDSNAKKTDEKALCNDLKKIKDDIIKECMENFIDHLKRLKER